MPENTETVTTSEEIRVPSSIWSKLWGNIYIKEFILMVGAAVGLQLGVALLDLSGQVDSVNNLSSLYQTVSGWVYSAFTAIILTAFKQTLAFCIAKLAKTSL